PTSGPCRKKTYITATTIETFAEDLLFAAARRRPQITRKAQTALVAAERQLTEAEPDLVGYRDNPHVYRVLTAEQFADGLAVRNHAIRNAADRFADARAASDELGLLKLRAIQKR